MKTRVASSQVCVLNYAGDCISEQELPWLLLQQSTSKSTQSSKRVVFGRAKCKRMHKCLQHDPTLCGCFEQGPTNLHLLQIIIREPKISSKRKTSGKLQRFGFRHWLCNFLLQVFVIYQPFQRDSSESWVDFGSGIREHMDKVYEAIECSFMLNWLRWRL